MQRAKIAAILGILLILSCCCLTGLYVDGYYLPFKVCRPITYPDGSLNPTRDNTWFSYTVEDPIDDVTLFYDQQLPLGMRHRLWGVDLGRWEKNKIGDADYVYSCYGSDINYITIESGCVSVKKEEQGTHIRGWLVRSDSSNVPCFGR